MALSVTLTSLTPANTYRLPVEEYSFEIVRSPLQSPLYANIDPIIYDLGQFRPSITVAGIIEATTKTDGGVTIPSKDLLEDFSRATYNDTITIALNFGGVTDTYTGKISRLRLVAKGSTDGWWDFVLQLVTLGRSP